MSNRETAANAGSSSNPPPTEESPRRGGRGRGEATPPHLNPHGRGSPPTHPWEGSLFTPPRPRPPPVMGTPGRTAFGPYRPPAPQWPSPGPTHAPGESSHSLGFHAAGAGGAGGSGGGVAVAAAGGIRIGGSPSGRKRVRDGGAGGGAAAAGGGAGDGGGNAGPVQHCSVCNKGFGSAKALFGHMRSHPDRGWKGVHPPPAFRAEEEFADLQVAAAEAEAAEPQAEEEGNDYRVPDLNGPPPEDEN